MLSGNGTELCCIQDHINRCVSAFNCTRETTACPPQMKWNIGTDSGRLNGKWVLLFGHCWLPFLLYCIYNHYINNPIPQFFKGLITYLYSTINSSLVKSSQNNDINWKVIYLRRRLLKYSPMNQGNVLCHNMVIGGLLSYLRTLAHSLSIKEYSCWNKIRDN